MLARRCFKDPPIQPFRLERLLDHITHIAKRLHLRADEDFEALIVRCLSSGHNTVQEHMTKYARVQTG